MVPRQIGSLCDRLICVIVLLDNILFLMGAYWFNWKHACPAYYCLLVLRTKLLDHINLLDKTSCL